MLRCHAATWDAQPRGPHWERSPAPSPASEGGIGLSLEAAAGPTSDAAFGRNAAPRAGMLLQYTSDCGSSGERRGKGVLAVAPGNSHGRSLMALSIYPHETPFLEARP